MGTGQELGVGVGADDFQQLGQEGMVASRELPKSCPHSDFSPVMLTHADFTHLTFRAIGK